MPLPWPVKSVDTCKMSPLGTELIIEQCHGLSSELTLGHCLSLSGELTLGQCHCLSVNSRTVSLLIC